MSSHVEKIEMEINLAAPPRAGTFKANWYTVWMLSFISVLAQIDRGVVSLLVEPIKRDLQLSDTQISVLLGFAFTFFYIMVGPPASRVTDRGSRKLVVVAGLTVWSFATALCGIAQNFWALFFARAGVGGGESVHGPASMSMISDCVPREHLSRAYALLNAGVLIGMALSLVIGGVVITLLSGVGPFHVPGIGLIRNWQLVFLIVGIPGLFVAMLTLFTVPEPARQGVSASKGIPFRQVVRFVVDQRRIHLPLLLGLVLSAIQTYGLAAWGPAFYERTYGWGPARSGPLLGMTMLGSALLGLWLGTVLAERLAHRNDDANLRVLMLAQLLPLPFAIAGPLMPDPWLALGCAFLAGIFGVMGGPSYNAALQIITPNQMRGQVNALYLFTISAIGGAIGPTFVALLTDYVAGSEEALRYVMAAIRAVLGPLAVVLVWRAMRPYARVYRTAVDAGE